MAPTSATIRELQKAAGEMSAHNIRIRETISSYIGNPPTMSELCTTLLESSKLNQACMEYVMSCSSMMSSSIGDLQQPLPDARLAPLADRSRPTTSNSAFTSTSDAPPASVNMGDSDDDEAPVRSEVSRVAAVRQAPPTIKTQMTQSSSLASFASINMGDSDEEDSGRSQISQPVPRKSTIPSSRPTQVEMDSGVRMEDKMSDLNFMDMNIDGSGDDEPKMASSFIDLVTSRYGNLAQKAVRTVINVKANTAPASRALPSFKTLLGDGFKATPANAICASLLDALDADHRDSKGTLYKVIMANDEAKCSFLFVLNRL